MNILQGEQYDFREHTQYIYYNHNSFVCMIYIQVNYNIRQINLKKRKYINAQRLRRQSLSMPPRHQGRTGV